MIMHRPPCYAYTVLLSLSYPPPRRLVPSPPVRLEQQSPRTLRARSVTHPLIRTDNRFWQAHSLRSLASYRITRISPRVEESRSIPPPLFLETRSPPLPPFYRHAQRFREFTGQLFLHDFTANVHRWKEKKEKEKKRQRLAFHAASFRPPPIFLPCFGPPRFLFFQKDRFSRIGSVSPLIGCRVSEEGPRVCVCTCACVRVCVKNRTLREVIGIGERGGSSRVKEHFRLALRRTMDALDFHLVKRDSMGEGRGGDSFQLKYPRFF